MVSEGKSTNGSLAVLKFENSLLSQMEKKSTVGQITKGVHEGFAYDTNVFNFGHNLPQLINETSAELHQLDVLLKANMLEVNTTKTNYCLLRSSSNKFASTTETYKVKMGDILNHSDDTKYLGVILVIQLSWEKQVNKMKSEIIECTSIFCKLRYYVPKACLTTLYDALVLSKIACLCIQSLRLCCSIVY